MTLATLRALVQRASGLGIRGRLVLLVLALGLPFVIYILISAAERTARGRDVAMERSLAVARVIAAGLDDNVGDIKQLLATLSYVVPVSPETAAENDALLRRLGPNLPSHVNNVAVWDRAGNNVGSPDPAILVGPVNVADHPFFRAAFDGQALTVEAPLISRSDGKAFAMFARAVTQDGRTVGVVSASAQLVHMQSLLDPKGTLPAGSVITLINERGVVLGRTIDPEKWIGQSVASQRNIMEAVARREGTRETHGLDGVARLGGYTTARSVPWLVYVGVPVEAALAPLHAQLRESLSLGAGALVLGLIAAALIGEGIARPLRKLADDAAVLAQGELDHRSSVASGGEAGVLAESLNSMAQALHDRALALSRSEQRLRLITDNVPAFISYIDRERRYRFVNAFYRDIFGIEPQEMLGKTVREVRGNAAYDTIEPRLDEALGGFPVHYQQTYEGIKGARDLSITYLPDYRESDVREVEGIYVMGLDVTAQKRAECALAQSEAQLRAIANHLPVLIAVVGRDERYRFCNSTYRDWLDVEPETLIGKSLAEALGAAAYAADKPFIDRALAGETVSFERSGSFGGIERHTLETYIPLRSETTQAIEGFYVLVQDLTVRKVLEDKLSHMAQYDQLTGLPNRYLLHDRLAQACARSQREGIQLAVLYLDLDGFKHINDTRGHAAGDAILREFARRAVAAIRASDTVARIGGDEFVVLVEGFFSYRELEAMARRIVRLVEAPFTVEGDPACVSTSVGVATFPPANSWEDLLRAADAAMYEAKAKGKGAVVIAPLKAVDKARLAWTAPAKHKIDISSGGGAE